MSFTSFKSESQSETLTLGNSKFVFFQPKLTVNQPNDIYEQEAEAVSEQVVQMPLNKNGNTFFRPATISTILSNPIVNRKCAECEEEEKLQRKGNCNREVEASNELESYVGGLNSRGDMLPNNTRSFFEPRFGYDFSDVRIHNDTVAAKSAQSINALAYTSGINIVFNKNQYSPETDSGKRLLGHELTHVVQQNSVNNISKYSKVSGQGVNQSNNSAKVVESFDESGIMRQETTEETPQQTPSATTGCNQIDSINRARMGAFVRCQRALERVAGIGSPPPDRRPDPRGEWQQRARQLVRRIFGEDLNMEQVEDIIGSMRNRLASPTLPIVCTRASDNNCGNRAGYVIDFRPPVYLCPAFFKSSPEQQIRTLIHEAAHMSGIGEVIGESYCVDFDCETSCGGFDVADSWAHFVHCISGQTPDIPIVIKGQVP